MILRAISSTRSMSKVLLLTAGPVLRLASPFFLLWSKIASQQQSLSCAAAYRWRCYRQRTTHHLGRSLGRRATRRQCRVVIDTGPAQRLRLTMSMSKPASIEATPECVAPQSETTSEHTPLAKSLSASFGPPSRPLTALEVELILQDAVEKFAVLAAIGRIHSVIDAHYRGRPRVHSVGEGPHVKLMLLRSSANREERMIDYSYIP